MTFLYKFFGVKWFTTWDKNKIIAMLETIASLYVYFGWTFLVYAKPLYYNPFCIAWLLCGIYICKTATEQCSRCGRNFLDHDDFIKHANEEHKK